MAELPKHASELPEREEAAKRSVLRNEHVPRNAHRAPGRLRANWLWVLLVLLGAALMLAPIRLGMYSEAAEGQRMLERFAPVLTDQRLRQLEDHLAVIEAARAETAERHLPGDDLSHSNTISFVAQFPETEARFSSWIVTMRADEGTFGQLRSLPPFGLFPFVFGSAGLALVIIGTIGLLSRSGRARAALRCAATAVGVLLILFPVGAGVFANSSAGSKLLRDFRPVLTEENVRWAQNEFVVIGPSSAELLNDLNTNPGADLPATKTFVGQWATISADFANVIEEFADNLGHFQALERLNETTKPLGFRAFDQFGWFFVAPGLALVLLVGADVLLVRSRNNPQEQT